jgi:hypothetical protein
MGKDVILILIYFIVYIRDLEPYKYKQNVNCKIYLQILIELIVKPFAN